MNRHRFLAIGAACGLLVSSAHGDWYVGANVGQSSIDASADEIEDAFLIDDDFIASGTSLDKTDTGWKAYLGYRFVSWLSVEAAYADLGKATFDTTITAAPFPFDTLTPFDLEGTATADGPQLSAVLQTPLAGPLSAFARAGAFRWEAEFTEFIPGIDTTRVARTEAKTDLLYGVGLQVDFAVVGARLEWERLENVGEGIGARGGRDIDFLSVGIVFDF